MDGNHTLRRTELHGIVEQKLTGLIRELEAADWSAETVALAIRDILESQWLSRMAALRNASASLPRDFVSDGNEG